MLDFNADPSKGWTINATGVPPWLLTALASVRVVVWTDANGRAHVGVMGQNSAAPNDSGGLAQVVSAAATAAGSTIALHTEPGMASSHYQVNGAELLAALLGAYQKQRTALRALILATPGLAAQVDELAP